MVQCGAEWFSVLQYIAFWGVIFAEALSNYSVLQCVAVCCSVLQCVAVCCSVFQCGAVCCSMWQRGECGNAW